MKAFSNVSAASSWRTSCSGPGHGALGLAVGFVFGSAFGSLGCANSMQNSTAEPLPNSASRAAAIARATTSPQDGIEDNRAALEQLSAAQLLHKAFEHLRLGENRRAARAFYAAVSTGALNDAGRAWAYWHIYVTERDLGRMDASADALAGFVVVGEDMLSDRDETRDLVDDDGDFVDRFDLRRRVSLARAMLSVIWAQRVPPYGRSEQRPIPVHTVREIDYFLELVAPCGNEEARRISTAKVASTVGDTQRITVNCAQSQAQYYFFAPGIDR